MQLSVDGAIVDVDAVVVTDRVVVGRHLGIEVDFVAVEQLFSAMEGNHKDRFIPIATMTQYYTPLDLLRYMSQLV